MFLDVFNDLLEEKGLNRKKFAELSGIPYTTVIGWTNLNRLPDYTALIKIADFFQCSIDFLTGRQDEYGNAYPSPDISRERALIKNFHKLDPEAQDAILHLTVCLARNNKENRSNHKK